MIMGAVIKLGLIKPDCVFVEVEQMPIGQTLIALRSVGQSSVALGLIIKI
jgi:hypothetical protein